MTSERIGGEDPSRRLVEILYGNVIERLAGSVKSDFTEMYQASQSKPALSLENLWKRIGPGAITIANNAFYEKARVLVDNKNFSEEDSSLLIKTFSRSKMDTLTAAETKFIDTIANSILNPSDDEQTQLNAFVNESRTSSKLQSYLRNQFPEDQ